jgi:hypothetical protein
LDGLQSLSAKEDCCIHPNKYRMLDCFFHLPKLNTVEYSSYFLNEFIPKYKVIEELDRTKSTKSISYVQYFIFQMPNLLKFNAHLKLVYNFPDIEYFLIFKHHTDQPIHADGLQILRHSSLNLPISGYENTKTIFYKETFVNPNREIQDANYYNIENLSPIAELQGTNDWVMINTGIPHQVIGATASNPRITVCFRFFSNPTINRLLEGIP